MCHTHKSIRKKVLVVNTFDACLNPNSNTVFSASSLM